MQELLYYRGPNDAGSWINSDKTVGLAHRRLSIIDLSIAGHQPMSDEEDILHNAKADYLNS